MSLFSPSSLRLARAVPMAWFRRRWPPGVRIQLTLWYALIFALVLAFAGVIFYAALHSSLAANLDADLHLRTQQVAAGISNENGTIQIQDITGELPGLGQTDGSPDAAPTTSSSSTVPTSDVNLGTLVRVLDAHGTVTYISPAFRNLAVPPQALADPLRGTSWIGTINAGGGQSVRLYSAALIENGQVFGVVQVGQTLAPLSATLSRIVTVLVLITPFVLVLSALGSYWLAGRAFAPIARLSRVARDIEAGDLHRRVPVPPARDEVRELAETLNDMIARLEAAFARQRRFIADASHELRTPVAVMLSTIENALDLDPGQDPAPALHEVRAEALRLRSLSTDLLSLARADEQGITLERERLRLDLLVADVAASLAPLAEEQGIALMTDQLDRVFISGDSAQILLVLMNLVENALKYTDSGGRVSLALHAARQTAQVVIVDTGIGIAPEELPFIFDRFYRADHGRSSQSGGSGLGLAIAQMIVTAHGGTIAVTSQAGQGSVFTLTLPLDEAAHRGATTRSRKTTVPSLTPRSPATP